MSKSLEEHYKLMLQQQSERKALQERAEYEKNAQLQKQRQEYINRLNESVINNTSTSNAAGAGGSIKPLDIEMFNLYGLTKNATMVLSNNSIYNITDLEAEPVLLSKLFQDDINVEYSSVSAYNTDNKKLYILTNELYLDTNTNKLVFYLYENDELVKISETTYGLFLFTDFGYDNYSISVGGRYMLGGEDNKLTTNISSQNIDNIYIPYTHTKQLSDSYAGANKNNVLFDGTINVSTSDVYFGEGSSYFTNLYQGLFVMCAHNVSATEFYVVGDSQLAGYAQFTHNETYQIDGYTVILNIAYYDDKSHASVHRAIIVDTVSENLVVSQDLNNFGISNLDATGATKIQYMLFSTTDGTMIDIFKVGQMINKYIELTDNKTIEQALSSLNLFHTDITDIVGLSVLDIVGSPNAMYYDGNGNVNYINSENVLCSIDCNIGDTSVILAGFTVNTLFKYKDEIYITNDIFINKYDIENDTSLTWNVLSVTNFTQWDYVKVSSAISITCLNDDVVYGIFKVTNTDDENEYIYCVGTLNVDSAEVTYLSTISEYSSLVSLLK